MQQKIFDSEWWLMTLIWENGTMSAKDLSLLAKERIGWNKNTTYTVLGKLEAKGYIQREDPGFLCTALVSRDEICKNETRSLVQRLFGGSKKALFSALLEDESLSKEELEELRALIEKR